MVFGAVIQPYLGDLLPVRQRHPYPQRAARHLQVGQAVALRVGGYFIHPCRRLRQVGRGQGQPVQPLQQPGDALLPQRRPPKAGEPFPAGHRCRKAFRSQRPALQILLHQPLVTQRQRFLLGICGQAGRGELLLQVFQNLVPVGSRPVHFIDENKNRQPVALQQPPQRFGVRLHPVRPADDKQRIIQYRKGTLHLRPKVRMTGGVQQRQLGMGQRQPCLLGKYGDAPAALLRIGVEKGVPVVHPAGLPQSPGAYQHRLGQGGLAAVHMGHQPQRDILFFHGKSPFPAAVSGLFPADTGCPR